MRQASRQDYVDWIGRTRWDIAISLNFRSGISKQDAIRAAKYFWQRLDQMAHGKRAVRDKNKRVPRACFLEGESGVRNWHFHCAMQIPRTFADTDPKFLAAKLHFLWREVDEAGEYSVIKPIYDARGWISYICKSAGKGEQQFCEQTSCGL